MADKKISALTAASTPLAGSEVLPIVQSGSTVKVSVNNVTAGKAVPVGEVVATGISGLAYKFNASGTWAQPDLIGHRWTGTQDSARIVPPGFYANLSYLDVLASGDFTSPGNFVPATAAKGINFTANTPAAGMTSQLLNWYEEGDWTGTMVGTTTNPTTPVTATGRYTRIGRNVTIAITFANVNTTGASGSLRINGAPFTASAEQCLGTVFTLGFTATAPVCSIVSGTQISVIEAATGADIAIPSGATKYLGLTLTYFV